MVLLRGSNTPDASLLFLLMVAWILLGPVHFSLQTCAGIGPLWT